MRMLAKRKLWSFTPIQLIVLYYTIAAIVSTILLMLPIAVKDGVEWTFIDALFTAISAISVTGLTVVSTVDTFSVPGIFILAFILQFGGIGLMTLMTFMWMLFRKKISYQNRKLITYDQNRITYKGLVIYIKQILLIIITIETLGMLVLGTYFLKYFPNWQTAYLQGFFASISATTNAGFDITGSSLVPYANDYFVQLIYIILLIVGAIGFPVLIELRDSLSFMKWNKRFRFSLYVKLTTLTFFILIVLGGLLIYLFEFNHYFAHKPWHQTLFSSLFHSVSARNGGLATMDLNNLSTATQLTLAMLMIIGASPSSVGGGIRTTTFAIVILAMYAQIRGQGSVRIFKRELEKDDIAKSFAIVMIAFLVCSSSVVILSVIEPFSLKSIIFEVCSAFGTTGLSLGITPSLSNAGKIVIIVLMFIGRIGILTFIYSVSGEQEQEQYHHPKEYVLTD
ncbi:TrkH family potassium uptake protein [Cytobacillus sp. Hm23]